MAGPTLIQIKRSILTGSTPTLANGELAFTANGDVLFIGSNAATIPIASKRTPGVLTANQGIVTNTTNMIDVIRIGNSTVNAVLNQANLILANSTVNTAVRVPTAAEYAGSYYLKADGSWSTVTAGSALPAGANTHVQYNDSGVTGGVAAFTFDEVANNITVSNSVITGSVTQNVGGFYAGANVKLDTIALSIGNTTVNTFANSIIVYVANSTGFANHSPTQVLVGNSTIVSNLGIGTIFLGNSTINSISNSQQLTIANSTASYTLNRPTAAQITSADYYHASDSTWKQVVVSSTLDALTDVTIAGVANNDFIVYDNVAGQWENHPAGNGFTFAGQVPALLAGSTLTVNTLGAHVNSALSIQDLTLGGNLTVTGTLSTVDAVNLVVNDSIISLARNNGGDTLDIGFYGQYNDGAERFTGLIWDTTDDSYYLFANTSTEPTTVLSIADANLRYSTLRTYLISNAFTSNATAVNITATASTSSVLTINTLSVSGVSTLAAQIANSTGFVPTSNTVGQNFGNTIARWNITGNTIVLAGQSANSFGLYPVSNTVGQLFGNTISRWEITANSLVLSTALLGTSGGTGLASIADQSILKGNTTNGYTALALGTAGLVLQSFGGALIYDTLDGGTF